MTGKDYKERLKEISIEERKKMYCINKHDIELIKIMKEMQKKLDEQILKSHNILEINEDFLNIAILDEIGELTHELKYEWCWWKKGQAPVDKEKVLGELVDIWHFVLSWQNNFNKGEKGIDNKGMVARNYENILILLRNKEYNLAETLCDLVVWNWLKVERLTAITEFLGFAIEDVYQAYCEKNKVNYQRLESGY